MTLELQLEEGEGPEETLNPQAASHPPGSSCTHFLSFTLKKQNRTLLTLMNSIYIHYEYFKILNEAKTLLFKYISVTRS